MVNPYPQLGMIGELRIESDPEGGSVHYWLVMGIAEPAPLQEPAARAFRASR